MNSEKTKISIVTPVYNAQNFIRRLYDSLFYQDDIGFEWIVIDDRSQDNTLEIVKNLPPPGLLGMSVYQMPFNSGGAIACSVGHIKAKGDIIVKIDHDDELKPNAVRRIREEFCKIGDESSIAGVLLPSVQPGDNRVISSLRGGQRFKTSEFRRFERVTTDGVLALKASIARHYYSLPERARISLSSATLLNMSKEYSFLYAGGEPVMIYHRDNPESMTMSPKVSNKTVFTYARILDHHDWNYYAQPIRWARHTLALIHFALSYHGSASVVGKYLERRSTRIWYFCMLPLGVVAHYFKAKIRIVHYEEADPVQCSEGAVMIKKNID